MKRFGGRLQIITGDITKLQVDGIVNAANGSLLGGGGVDGAIHRGAGSSLLEECRRIRQDQWPEGMPTGHAVMTGAGNLPCRYVIHTVGPVWHGGNRGEEELLENAYRNSLILAEEKGMETIAFPAISTGVYGYPPERAAPVVYSVVKDFVNTHELPRIITLIFFSPSGRDTFLRNIPREES